MPATHRSDATGNELTRGHRWVLSRLAQSGPLWDAGTSGRPHAGVGPRPPSAATSGRPRPQRKPAPGSPHVGTGTAAENSEVPLAPVAVAVTRCPVGIGEVVGTLRVAFPVSSVMIRTGPPRKSLASSSLGLE